MPCLIGTNEQRGGLSVLMHLVSTESSTGGDMSDIEKEFIHMIISCTLLSIPLAIALKALSWLFGLDCQ